MNQERTDISVITPFYRGNSFMKQLFGCIRRNACTAVGIHIELVLVNDSPDCPICYDERWVDGFSLQIYNNPVNLGIQGSRVKGLQLAKGEFVVFLDQDDLLSDNALLSQYGFVDGNDVIVANGYNENRDRNRPIFQSLTHQRQVVSPRFYLSVGCLIVSPGQCLIRRSVIPALWKESLIDCNGADDYFLWLLLHGNARWQINPEVLYTHVDTGENVSLNLDRMIQSSEEVLDILKAERMLTVRQVSVAKRRFAMRKLYEGREKWRKLVACAKYPDLFLEMVWYAFLKKCCP